MITDLFKSLCKIGGLHICKYKTPFAASKAILLLSSQLKGISWFYSKDHRDPLAQNSKIMQKSGYLVHAPKNMTIFGCLNASIAWHSDRKSLNEFSFI